MSHSLGGLHYVDAAGILPDERGDRSEDTAVLDHIEMCDAVHGHEAARNAVRGPATVLPVAQRHEVDGAVAVAVLDAVRRLVEAGAHRIRVHVAADGAVKRRGRVRIRGWGSRAHESAPAHGGGGGDRAFHWDGALNGRPRTSGRS
eukprot:7377202-Prymnesium_polylepis.1